MSADSIKRGRGTSLLLGNKVPILVETLVSYLKSRCWWYDHVLLPWKSVLMEICFLKVQVWFQTGIKLGRKNDMDSDKYCRQSRLLGQVGSSQCQQPYSADSVFFLAISMVGDKTMYDYSINKAFPFYFVAWSIKVCSWSSLRRPCEDTKWIV